MNLFKILFVDCRYFVALTIRLAMVLISEILYTQYNFVYTDIDYHVFNDAAKHMINFESPFNRETYRYTPLLALMMIPNHLININVGKILFCFTDVLVGLCIEILLLIQRKNKGKEETPPDEKIIYTKNIFQTIYSYIDNPFAYVSLLYLYNPLTINICTRGSADCIITLLVLLTLIFIELGLFPIAGIIYGLAIHFKIYPLIYAPALYMYLIYKEHVKRENINLQINQERVEVREEVVQANESIVSIIYRKLISLNKQMISHVWQVIKFILKYFLHYKALIFALLTISVFAGLFFFFYILFGNKFAYEYFFYHLVRKDHRHNYSIFYYLIYLTYNWSLSNLLSLITFVPQITMIILSTLLLFTDINNCLLILTMIFVTFNKVVTAQYFLWYISLLPLIAPYNNLFKGRKILGVFLFIVWLFFELLWNNFSHRLEVKGQNLFLEIWGINVIFFLINCTVISQILCGQEKH
jgi:phosphatidylinositol glycan class M